MTFLSPTGLKVLKIIHLLSAIAWFGTAIIMNAIRVLIDLDSPEAMYYVAQVLHAIDMKILVPGAIMCLLTGIVYGIWTKWGFFKHRWLIVKWILTIFMIALGTFYIGPMVTENVTIGAQLVQGTGDLAQYQSNLSNNAWAGGLQLTLLCFVVIISVIKPWKKKK